jgi:hypothetical protein
VAPEFLTEFLSILFRNLSFLAGELSQQPSVYEGGGGKEVCTKTPPLSPWTL